MGFIAYGLWVAEKRPDFFSKLIMWAMRRPYSHNELLLPNGRVWHCYEPGVVEEPFAFAMRGCKIVAIKEIQFWSEESLMKFLEQERGKPYGTKQNWAYLLPFLRPWVVNKNKARNCSEFFGSVVANVGRIRIPGAKDWWTPAYLEKVLKPSRDKRVINNVLVNLGLA